MIFFCKSLFIGAGLFQDYLDVYFIERQLKKRLDYLF